MRRDKGPATEVSRTQRKNAESTNTHHGSINQGPKRVIHQESRSESGPQQNWSHFIVRSSGEPRCREKPGAEPEGVSGGESPGNNGLTDNYLMNCIGATTPSTTVHARLGGLPGTPGARRVPKG
jgi:hypothetical protein